MGWQGYKCTNCFHYYLDIDYCRLKKMKAKLGTCNCNWGPAEGIKDPAHQHLYTRKEELNDSN